MSIEVMPGLIRRSNLVEMVHDAIEEAVRRGELEAGGRQFTEAALCRKFNVSRPTVREALIRLRARGALADHGKDNGGAPRYEALSSITELGRHFEFRRTIEIGAAGQCALHRDAAGLKRMETAIGAFRSPADSGRMSADADFLFHLAIARASGNPVFLAVMEGLRAHALFAMNLSWQFSHQHAGTQRAAHIDDEHRMIFEAILDRDEQRAQAAMRAHIDNAAARVFGNPDREGQPANAAA